MDNIKQQIEYDGPLEIEAYLRKMRIKNRNKSIEKTSLKYFKISLKSNKFSYKNHKSLNTWRMEIPLDEFLRFIPYLDNEHKNICDFKYGFQLLTKNKYLVLFCEEEIFNYDWVKLLEYVVNKRDLTYDNYEKFILSQNVFENDGLDEWNNNEIFDENKEEEFSFSKTLNKEDVDLDDSDMFVNNILNKNVTKNDQIDKNPIDNYEDRNPIRYQSFKDNVIYTSNKNNFGTFNKEGEFPVYVDVNRSRPIQHLRQYKINKDDNFINFSISNQNVNPNHKENFYQYNQSYNPNKNQVPVLEFDTEKEEHSIDLFNDKDGLNEFLSFDFEEKNLNSRSTKFINEKLIPVPVDLPIKTTNAAKNIINPTSSAQNSNNNEEKKSNVTVKEKKEKEESHKSNKKTQESNSNFNNSKNSINNNSLFSNSNSISVKSDKTSKINDKNPKEVSFNLNLNSNDSKIPKGNAPLSNNSNFNIQNSSIKNYENVGTNTNINITTSSAVSGPNSNLTTYIPKKISSNKSVNNQINPNNQSIHTTASHSSSKTATNSIKNSSIGNNSQSKRDPMYDNGHMHIKQDVKKEKINLENLNFGIDDYKKNIENTPNILIGSVPLKNIKKIGSKDESEVMETLIRKKNSGLKKKLTPEDSLIVLKNIKKAPTNDNVIVEESLKEEGNTWVLNVKVKKHEKI